jgi:hypothetical protein
VQQRFVLSMENLEMGAHGVPGFAGISLLKRFQNFGVPGQRNLAGAGKLLAFLNLLVKEFPDRPQ